MLSRLFIIFFNITLVSEIKQPEFECAKWYKDDSINSRVLDVLKNVEKFKAEFEQLSYSVASSEIDLGNGLIYGKKPRNVRLDYQNPELTTFVLVGEAAISVNMETGEVEHFRINQSEASKMPVSLIVDGKLSKELIYVGSCENQYGFLSKFEKISNDSKEYSLTVLINKNLEFVKGVKFEDFGGVINSFLFNNFQKNIELKDSLFNVTAK